MKKIYLLILLCLVTVYAKAQTYTMPTSGTLSATICGGNFYDNGGPGGNYACCSIAGVYTFYPSIPGAKVSVTFSSFAVETCCDYLQIFNGNSTGAPMVGQYNSLPPTVTSSAADGSLTFYFWSDVSVVSSGFAATLSLVGGTSPITSQPVSSTTVCSGAAPSISVGATTGSTYQWYSNGTTNSNTGGTLIAGATNSSYSPSTATAGTTYYYAVVTNGCPFTTNTSAIIVNASPAIIGGSLAVCKNATTTLTNTSTPGTWNSVTPGVATINSTSGLVNGISVGTSIVSYTLTSTGCVRTGIVTVNPLSDLSNFSVPSATNSCSGSGSIVTINSTTLGAGTYTVVYNLSGANSSSANTATLTMGTFSGSFIVPGAILGTQGATTLTITGITNSLGCTTNPTIGNTASFAVGVNPNITNYTSTSATSVCGGAASTATINSTSLGAGTFTVTYNVTGANSSTGNTATLTMGASNGTFSIPGTLLTNAGATTVTVTAIQSAAGCVSNPVVNNTAGITVSAAGPLASMTGGGSYCTGGSGVAVGLSTSGASVVNYALYRGATLVTTVNGTNAAINFGLQTVAGIYSVVATHSVSGCVTNMLGSATVSVASLPTAYAVGGGGSYCSGGTGVVVSLSNSDAGASYQLYNGATPVGGLVFGTGAPISLGTQTASGTYTAIANPGAGGACQLNMNGSATVVINPLPTVYPVTGGGNYCAGGAGSPVGLTFGASGIQYTLYNGSSIATVAAGTNAALSFGSFTATGTYSVSALNTSTGCTIGMSGTAVIGVTALPTPFAMTGGGTLCSGGAGVAVGLGGSSSGVSYQLYNGASTVGSAVAGTTAALAFGAQTTAGIYTVLATASGCSSAMTGSATVIVNPTPTVFTVGGGGTLCAGAAGVAVTLNGSASGVNYQLFRGATSVATVAGTNSSLNFGTFNTAGTYTVLATATTTCTANMVGSAVVTVNTPPTAYNVTGGGGYCNGGTGVAIGLANSESGVSYTLYLGATAVTTLPGSTGSSLNFGNSTTGGTYTIVGVNTTTGCSTTMTGSATVVVNALPTAFAVTGGGNYCAGGTGVTVGLGGSATGVNYTLYNGPTAVGSAVAGTNAPISFGLQTLSATFTVFAVNPTTGCSNTMSGSAAVGINPLPTAFAVTGGGSYCAGSTGVAVGLGASTVGVNYQLYNGGVAVGGPMPGTTAAINFGTMTAAGTYTVQATNATTNCTSAMAGNAVISINAVPNAAFTVTSSGSAYCAGGAGITLGLSGSQTGINYQLYNGSATSGSLVAGTNSAISFGAKTVAGTYTVQAVNATNGCTSNIASSASITINPTPTVFGVTGGGSYCNGGAGVNIGLSGSTLGVNYQLYNGAGTVGSAVAGTNSAISFGVMSTTGTYTVLATNAATLCTSNMSSSATVSVNAIPAVQTLTGGGVYCAGGSGVNIGLGNSVSGVTYQLFNGSSAGTSVSGTNAPISFGLQTATGTYSVLATNGLGCTAAMSGTATISTNPTPFVYNVTGGGSYCASGTGVSITLSSSNTGISYQLFNSGLPYGTALPGTGGSITFTGVTPGGNYNVIATNSTTLCTSNMAGSATVNVNALPTQFTVTGGGSYCNGGAGVDVALSGSTPGVAYQLYNGTVAVGSLVAGNSLPLDFGYKTVAGNYTVMAVNTATSCTNAMLGSASISVNSLPIAYTVTGGGGYCSGTTGVHIGMENSAAGVSYQLYNGSAIAGTPVIGGSGAIDFGVYSVAGTYSVLASNTSTGCSNAMSGNAVVSINPLPFVYNVSGGGVMCNGAAGVNVNLNNSTSGVTYQLYNLGSPVGAPVAGTGSAISFGPQTGNGSYTAIATNTATGCQRNMAGSATVVVNAIPNAYPVSGGGTYCAGGEGVAVSVGNSTPGISYQLYNGTVATGSPVISTGGAVNFGMQTAAGNNYNVIATNTTTGCTNNMTGAVSVAINPLPFAYTVSGGGSFCSGGTGVAITMNGSNTNMSYQLMNGTTNVGSSVNGTGGLMNFGMQTVAGIYAIVATNNTTGCTNMMSGNPTVIVNNTPTAYLMTGGGSYCSGDAGVAVGLASSNTGISYQLYNGTTAVGAAVIGNNNAISFGMQTVAGDYNVVATNNTTGCTNTMTGVSTVSINVLPANYSVNGGGSLCMGAAGVAVGMGNSTAGIQYQLFNGATVAGSTVLSTGGAFDFGAITTAGVYTVQATNPATGCVRNMSGSATVIVNTLPVLQIVTGGGSYCAGGNGIAIGLVSSVTGITYQLYNGATVAGSAVAGNGSGITFGLQTAAGTYSVLATNNTTGCTNAMTGTPAIIVNTPPNAYSVLGLGSSYCAGGSGVHILLSGSDAGVDYQLMNGTAPVGGTFAGTGDVIDFGAQLAPGVYKVVANNAASSCTSNMSGSAAVQISPLPAAYDVTGGGSYCNGSTGVAVGLQNSATGISYQLFRDGSAVGTAVAGNNAPISFGAQTGAGSYMVVATNNISGCTNNMTGAVNVSVNTLPGTYTVNGGGSYCEGGTGVFVGLGGSATGVTYQLYNGTTAVGAAVGGTGGNISFGPQTAAGVNYNVVATNTATTCSSNMTGSVSVIVKAKPATAPVTGSGSYCEGGAGLAVGLANSATGVTYQLYNGTSTVGAPVAGNTGSSLSFGTHTEGNYIVIGTSNVNGCTTTMTGSANIVANALPTAFAVTGGGSYCNTSSATGAPVGLFTSTSGVNYQLYHDGTAVGTMVAGNGSAITFGNQMAAGVYTVIATNAAGCSNIMSGSATISVNAPVVPVVSVTSAMGNTVCLGVLTTFTASSANGGSAPAYQWQVNGSNVGLGLSTYAYVPSNGDIVSVAMTSSESCAAPAIATSSIVMTVTSSQMPKANVSVAPNDTVCKGTTVTYTVTPEFGGVSPTYRWMKNGTQVATGTTYSYIPTDGDVITCKMVSDFPCRLQDEVSTDVKMTVDAPSTPVVNITANPGTYNAPGKTVTLTATATGAGRNPSFQWMMNGLPISGATNTTYTSSSFANNDSVSCMVINNGPCAATYGYASVIMKVVTTGVATVSNTLSDIRLLPNPNKGNFMIKGTLATTADQELTAEVTDMLGQVVYHGKVMARGGIVDEQIKVNNTLANGMYLLNLRSETENKAFHFVIEQ